MFTWALMGIFAGTVVGITGAGAAIIIMPMLLHFGHLPMHEATVFSLLAVFIAAVSNWYTQRKLTVPSVSVVLASMAGLGSYLTNPLKSQLPDTVLKTVFVVTVLASVVSLWTKKAKQPHENPRPFHWTPRLMVGLPLGGLVLGAIVTLGGIGGGVVIIPFLTGALEFPPRRAVSTTLLTTGLTALASMTIQFHRVADQWETHRVLALMGGIVTAAFLVKEALHRLHADHIERLRKVLFTIVILASVMGVIVN